MKRHDCTLVDHDRRQALTFVVDEREPFADSFERLAHRRVVARQAGGGVFLTREYQGVEALAHRARRADLHQPSSSRPFAYVARAHPSPCVRWGRARARDTAALAAAFAWILGITSST